MRTHPILDAIRETPPPPCERWGGCQYLEVCREKRMACNNFHRYVQPNVLRSPFPWIPNWRTYDKIYKGARDD